MAVGGSAADSLRVGRDARGWFIEARGSIRAALCYPLRDSLLERLEERPAAPGISVDLSGCTYMDSTFIGLLVAMDRKVRGASGGRLVLLRPSAESRDLLAQLSLLDVLAVDEAGCELPADMRDLETGLKPGADFVLKAHEALMETSEEARRKFSVLKEMLERKLKSEKAPPRGSS
jgi:anti-anti-sigma factor